MNCRSIGERSGARLAITLAVSGILSLLLRTSTAFSQNWVGGMTIDTWYGPPDSNPWPGGFIVDSGTNYGAGAVAGSWGVPGVSASGYANYGTNETSLTVPPDGEIAYTGYIACQWVDLVLITIPGAPSGLINVPYRLNYSIPIDGGDEVIATSVGISLGIEDTWGTGGGPVVEVGRLWFTNGVPFTLSGFLSDEGGSAERSSEASLTGILLPDGASIASLSGSTWLASIVVRPCLTISNAGPNVVLHWFALSGYDFNVETATSLTATKGSTPWTTLGGPGYPPGFVPVQTGDSEFTFTCPIDAVATRYFRIVSNY